MLDDEHPVIDWDEMSEEDRASAMDLLGKLNKLFDKYAEKDKSCEDSTSIE